MIVLLVVSSCVKEVIMDAGEIPQVVVECVLTDGPVQTLYLSFTKGASKKDAPPLLEAVAVLTDQTENKAVGQFVREEDGSWQLGYEAIPTHRYRLDVTVPDNEPIWAEQTMPERANCFAPRHWSYASKSALNLKSITEEEYLQGTRYRLDYLPDRTWVYALDFDEVSGQLRIAEEICTDYSHVDNFNVIGTYKPELLPYYEWLFGNPCEGWSLYPNLIGVGLHQRYLHLFKDNLNQQSDPTEIFISGNFLGRYFSATGDSNPKPTEGRIIFASVSEDYDIYLQEALFCYNLQQSTDLSSVYYRQNIYSNIHGGLGIFGAIIQTPMGWTRMYSPVNPEVVWDNPITAPKPFFPEDLPFNLFSNNI